MKYADMLGGMERSSRLDVRSGRRGLGLNGFHRSYRATPVTFWTGSNHGASIIKVEPLD